MSSFKVVDGEVRSKSPTGSVESFSFAEKEESVEDFVFIDNKGNELPHRPASAAILPAPQPSAPPVLSVQNHSLQVPALPSEVERLLEIAKSDSPRHSPTAVSLVVEQPSAQHFIPIPHEEPKEKLVGLATALAPQREFQVLPMLTVSDMMQRRLSQSPILDHRVTKESSEEEPASGPIEASSSDAHVPPQVQTPDWKALMSKAKIGLLGAVNWVGKLMDELLDEPPQDTSRRTSVSSREEID